ncbi:MAG: hypothetical protein ACTSU7_00265 [Candidatus Heimdallarchaeaceae archaeon]
MVNNYSKNVIIKIQTQFEDAGIKKTTRAIEGLHKRELFYNKWTKELKTNQEGVNKVMQSAGLNMDQMGNVTNKAGILQKRYGKTMRENSFASKKFEMSQLGIMFGGMALNRAMSNLNSTAREWVGINELMSTAMGMVTLPATMDLLEFGVLPLFEALTSLPEGAQKAIGYTTLALEGLGGVLMVGGQLMLGMDAFTRTIEKMTGTTMVANISGFKKGVQGAFDSKFAKGIGIVGLVAFTVSDIFFEEEGDFEWDKKLGAAAFAALFTKGGIAAKAKGGAVAFTILALIEIQMDPEGTGITFANIQNYFQKVFDGVADGVVWLGKATKALFTGGDIPDMPTSWSEWKEKTYEGYRGQLDELYEQGNLADSLTPYARNQKQNEPQTVSGGNSFVINVEDSNFQSKVKEILENETQEISRRVEI